MSTMRRFIYVSLQVLAVKDVEKQASHWASSIELQTQIMNTRLVLVPDKVNDYKILQKFLNFLDSLLALGQYHLWDRNKDNKQVELYLTDKKLWLDLGDYPYVSGIIINHYLN